MTQQVAIPDVVGVSQEELFSIFMRSLANPQQKGSRRGPVYLINKHASKGSLVEGGDGGGCRRPLKGAPYSGGGLTSVLGLGCWKDPPQHKEEPLSAHTGAKRGQRELVRTPGRSEKSAGRAG